MDKLPTDFQHLRFRKKRVRDGGEITLDGEMYQLLFAIEEGKPISRIVRESEMKPSVVRKTLTRLLDLELIEVVHEGATIIGKVFIDALIAHFTKAVGPFGAYLIEESVPQSYFSGKRMSPGEASELVLRLADEIQDGQKKHDFKRSMITHIMMGGEPR